LTEAGSTCRSYPEGYAGRRARTWITLAKAGRTPLAEEIGRLKLLISRVETADGQ
jgi:hypothetical protein